MVWVKPPMPKTFEKSYINVNSMNWLIVPVTDFCPLIFRRSVIIPLLFQGYSFALRTNKQRRHSEGRAKDERMKGFCSVSL